MGRNEERRATSLPTSKLTSNTYPINEKLEELIYRTDEEIRKDIRKDISAKRNFILAALTLSALILILILGIVSVAKASNTLEQRPWPSQSNPFEKKEQAVR